MCSSTIIMATYNNAAFLDEALDTALSRAPGDTEIVVVDDGSTDETGAILRNYQKHITSIYQSNQGPAAARNTGLRASRGNYVRFVDTDDLILPDSQSALLAALRTDVEVGAVHSGWEIVDQFGIVIGLSQPWHSAPQLGLCTWLTSNPVLLGAMMFRRSWLESVQGFDEYFWRSEDTDLLLRLALEGCAMHWLHQPTVQYRQHPGSLSRNPDQALVFSESLLDKFFSLPQLPAEIRAMEASCRFYRRTWVAGRLFFTGRLPEAEQKLMLSLAESPFDTAYTVSQWISQFEELQSNEPDEYAGRDWRIFLREVARTGAQNSGRLQRLANHLLRYRKKPGGRGKGA